MATNIFTQTKEFVNQPNRNTFDLSFQNNLTMEFGKLYPVFCKEVIPGDSFRITPTFALRMLPLVFPVQTRIKANLHFFYVRNRNLWKNWTKFIGHTDNTCVMPYISDPNSSRTRGLADYLGLPTTAYGIIRGLSDATAFTRISYTYSSPYYYTGASFKASNYSKFSQLENIIGMSFAYQYYIGYGRKFPTSIHILVENTKSGSDYEGLTAVYDKNLASIFNKSHGDAIFDFDKANSWYVRSEGIESSYDYDDWIDYVRSLIQSKEDFNIKVLFYDYPTNDLVPNVEVLNAPLSFRYTFNGSIDDGDVKFIGNPRISALPFRAYESIYNAFYRNEQNDPLIVDGKPTYDVYCPNTNDGEDNYKYQLHYRNWEPDFLTSAVQSPQQGIAPLVGVSQNGDFTFVNKDSDGNVNYFTAKASIGSDGKSITGFKLSDKVALRGVDQSTTKLDNVPDSVKSGTLYTLNQMALAGISINDFRNVNSLQRWLETNIRRGYKYKDQLMSHFGVDVKFDELDMPEFIGGMSEPIYINQVNATTENDNMPLGDYAGQGSVMATSDHSIENYCDEHGFIIGIMSICPVPNYSQILPKMFLKHNYLDFFFPEFGHIGMQPISNMEVAPLECLNEKDVNGTFGYQRPWYDYIASVDEVHGLFRTTLRNFVCNRVFSALPKLNHDFLKVDPAQLNDIFAVTDSYSDKILGQIYFEVEAKRPIPRMGIPRLE